MQAALREVMACRTSFVIAHRLSTVRSPDQILVLDGGRIVERGDHRSLLSTGRLYPELYRTGLEPAEPTAQAADPDGLPLPLPYPAPAATGGGPPISLRIP